MTMTRLLGLQERRHVGAMLRVRLRVRVRIWVSSRGRVMVRAGVRARIWESSDQT